MPPRNASRATVRKSCRPTGRRPKVPVAARVSRIFRSGHCGYFDAYDIIATIAATELALEALDYPDVLGRGVGAAQRVFSKSGVTARGS